MNAGHNPPILRRASGEIERLNVGGPPFGIPAFHDDGARYPLGRIQLRPGDVLFTFTDGLVEAINEAEEEYGEERLMASFQSRMFESAAETLHRIMKDVNVFAGNARQYDDITALVLRVQTS